MQTEHGTGHGRVRYVDAALMVGFRSAGLSFLHTVYGVSHPHYEQFALATAAHFDTSIASGLEILRSVKSEIGGGWLTSIRTLITAEVFSDFLDMAEHLLASGYKDAAAVMAGSVLEEHLRLLCGYAGISVIEVRDGRDVALKADRLNADLAKADVYSKLDQKLITAWLDLRNNAAHGHYDKYTHEQVANMKAGILEFMVRVAR